MAAARRRDLVRGGDDVDELREPEVARAARDLLVVGGDRDRDLVAVGRPLGDCDLCRDADDILREKADSKGESLGRSVQQNRQISSAKQADQFSDRRMRHSVQYIPYRSCYQRVHAAPLVEAIT